MISRAISDPDKPITWIYTDDQSPQFLFGDDDKYDYKNQVRDYTYLRATHPLPVTYEDVIRGLPDRGVLEELWSESTSVSGHSWINTDYMTFIGCAADEAVILK
jgi:hypothetical protein